MRETPIKDRIAKYLRQQPSTWFFKVHGSAMQAAGIPDFIGCRAGRLFGLEVKVPGRVATKLQQRTLELIAAAGGVTGVVTSVKDVERVFAASCSEVIDREADGTLVYWCWRRRGEWKGREGRACPRCQAEKLCSDEAAACLAALDEVQP